MTTNAVRLVGLTDQDQEAARIFASLAQAPGGIELQARIGHEEQVVPVPAALDRLLRQVIVEALRGEALVVLSENREITPNEAARILGLSRPLVVQRMTVGELPFRKVGAHRRLRLSDVLALKERLEAQRAGLGALAEDTEDLIATHGL